MARTKGSAKQHVPQQLKEAVSQSVRRGDITSREGASIVGRRSSRKSGGADSMEIDEQATPRIKNTRTRSSKSAMSVQSSIKEPNAKKNTPGRANGRRGTSTSTQSVDPRSARARQRAARVEMQDHSSLVPPEAAKPRRAHHCRNCGLPMKGHDDQCNRLQIELDSQAAADQILERTHLEAKVAKQRMIDTRQEQEAPGEGPTGTDDESFDQLADAMDEDQPLDIFPDLQEDDRDNMISASDDGDTHSGDTADISGSPERLHSGPSEPLRPPPAAHKPLARSPSEPKPTGQASSGDGLATRIDRARQTSSASSASPRRMSGILVRSPSLDDSGYPNSSEPRFSSRDATREYKNHQQAEQNNSKRDEGAARSESEPEWQPNGRSRHINGQQRATVTESERGEANGNGNDNGEGDEEGESEGEALTEAQTRKIAGDLGRGRVLTVKEARDLRRSLDRYQGPNKPSVDRFLVTTEKLKSSYQVKKYTHRLDGGVKATPNGAVQLPLSCGKRKICKSTYAERKKHRHERFNTFALKGDALAAAEDDEIWILAFAVPKTGAGELREWTSPAVRADAPRLSEQIRKQIFDHLNPHREQAVREREAQEQSWQKQLIDMKAEARAAEQRNRVLQEQMECMQRDHLRLKAAEEEKNMRRKERKDARRAVRAGEWEQEEQLAARKRHSAAFRQS